jgi:hypothetical protein
LLLNFTLNNAVERAAKKLPVAAYYDNRYVDELEKEGFFKKLWQ